jgi:hypothetical protein
MIIGKNFFITEMPKTGTTFLRNYFAQYKTIEQTIHHETINQNKRYNLLNFKNRIGIIRNPYEWYLSVWKWSCKKKRGSPFYSDLVSIRLKLKRLILNRRLYKYIFSQITKDRMLNYKNRQIIGSSYSFVPFKNLGYMTYIFFSQNVLRKNYNTLYNFKYSLEEVLDYNNSKLYTNIFFKTENLNYNLATFLKTNNIEIKSFNILDNNSTSKILKKNFKNFFSNKNILLIEKNEHYIFKKFKYKKLSEKL